MWRCSARWLRSLRIAAFRSTSSSPRRKPPYAASLGDGSLVEELAAKASSSLSGEEASLTGAEQLVQGIVIAVTAGYVPAAPTLRTALAHICEDVESDVAVTASAHAHTPALELLAVNAAAALLDDAAGQAVTRSWVESGGQARALSTLPIALDLTSVFEIFAGRFRAAESAMAEAEAILSFVGSAVTWATPVSARCSSMPTAVKKGRARRCSAQGTRCPRARRRHRSRSRPVPRSPCSSSAGVAMPRR